MMVAQNNLLEISNYLQEGTYSFENPLLESQSRTWAGVDEWVITEAAPAEATRFGEERAPAAAAWGGTSSVAGPDDPLNSPPFNSDMTSVLRFWSTKCKRTY